MRLLHAILLLTAMLLGQVQACTSQFVRADGLPCADCPSVGKFDHQPTAAKLASRQSCESCCHLKSCDQAHENHAIAPSAMVAFDIALPPKIELPQPRIVGQPSISIHVQACLPNAPPEIISGRAPPFRMN